MQLFISPLKPKQCQSSAAQCSPVQICKAWQSLFLSKPGADHCPAQSSFLTTCQLFERRLELLASLEPARLFSFLQTASMSFSVV